VQGWAPPSAVGYHTRSSLTPSQPGVFPIVSQAARRAEQATRGAHLTDRPAAADLDRALAPGPRIPPGTARLLADLAEALLVIDDQGVVVEATDTAAALLGDDGKPLVGRPDPFTHRSGVAARRYAVAWLPATGNLSISRTPLRPIPEGARW